jgi:tetratricopeptide (TPR) repeat protein
LYALVYKNSGVSIEESRKCNIDFPKDLEQNPSNAFAYNNRGAAHVKLGLYDKAVADFTEAIELKPSCALFDNNRETVQAGLGKYNEAIVDYTKAIELKPKFDLAINNQKKLMDKINFGKWNIGYKN